MAPQEAAAVRPIFAKEVTRRTSASWLVVVVVVVNAAKTEAAEMAVVSLDHLEGVAPQVVVAPRLTVGRVEATERLEAPGKAAEAGTVTAPEGAAAQGGTVVVVEREDSSALAVGADLAIRRGRLTLRVSNRATVT